MRIIKYRAYDLNNKQWYYLELKHGNTNYNITFSKWFGYGEHLPSLSDWQEFTGLLDKNGKEIYEFMELDNKYEVMYIAPKYVLRDISNNDIIDLYENTHTITKEYTKV